MKVVIQEETTGCGIAAVANILQKSYAEVKAKANQLGIFADDSRLYSDTQYVRHLLSEYAVNTSHNEMPFKSWQALPDTALLSINYHREGEHFFWHWVVFKRDQTVSVVFDSAAYLKQNRITDFQHITPEWFIEISKI